MAFRRFFRSPNFDGWYRLRHREMTQKVECLHLEAICTAVSMILDLNSVSAYITILLKSFLLSVQNVYANKWILKGFVHSNMIRSQVVPNLYAFFCLTHEKDFFCGIELVALFHAIALNVNRGFEASKRMQNYHKKHHKSIIRVVYDTTVQKFGVSQNCFSWYKWMFLFSKYRSNWRKLQ